MTYLKLGDTSGAFDSTDAVYASGAQHSNHDLDRFEVNLQANVNYEFRATPALFLGGSASNVEIKAVYNSSGTAQTIHRVEHNQRAYFTPSAAGTYYLEVGAVGGYANHSVVIKHLIDFHLDDLNGIEPEDIPLGVKLWPRSEYPTYTVRLRNADDYTATTATTAVVGSPDLTTTTDSSIIEGYFFARHNSVVDVDWVRVALKSGVTYRFTLDVKGHALIVDEIVGIYNSSGAKVNSSADADSTEQFDQGWVNYEYTPTADGDYYVGLSSKVRHISGRPVEHYGTDWIFKVWSNAQVAISEPAGGDLPGVDQILPIDAGSRRGAQQRRRRVGAHPQHRGHRPVRGMARRGRPLPHQRPRNNRSRQLHHAAAAGPAALVPHSEPGRRAGTTRFRDTVTPGDHQYFLHARVGWDVLPGGWPRTPLSGQEQL